MRRSSNLRLIDFEEGVVVNELERTLRMTDETDVVAVRLTLVAKDPRNASKQEGSEDQTHPECREDPQASLPEVTSQAIPSSTTTIKNPLRPKNP